MIWLRAKDRVCAAKMVRRSDEVHKEGCHQDSVQDDELCWDVAVVEGSCAIVVSDLQNPIQTCNVIA